MQKSAIRHGGGIAWRRSLRAGVQGALGAALIVVAAMAAGCAHAQARALADPPLDAPAAPPRDVAVVDPETPPIVALPDEPARTPPPRIRPTPPRAEAPRPPETKPEVPADVAPIPDTPRPAQTLQTTPTQQEQEMERQIRVTLSRASGDLNRINYQRLNSDARTQYDTAKRFLGQAEEAIKVRNLVFALNLADKASALASELAGR